LINSQGVIAIVLALAADIGGCRKKVYPVMRDVLPMLGFGKGFFQLQMA
jgi:hypothetical protein